MSVTPSDALALLQAFDPDGDRRAAASAQRIRRLLTTAAAPFSRAQYDPGHVTASGVVLAPDRRTVLLVYHERLARWLQPGGHIELGDASLPAAARREVREEAGLDVLLDAPRLVGLDVHDIPPSAAEPAHLHYDFMFCFTAADTTIPGGDSRAEWCAVDRLRDYGVDAPLLGGVARALRPAGE